MLKINKINGDNNNYIIELISDDITLVMYYGGTMDLFWYVEKKGGFSYSDINKTITFTITKEDYFIYSLFNELYLSIKNNNIITNNNGIIKNNNILVYNKIFLNKNIIWVSDDNKEDIANVLRIEAIEDGYNLHFTQKNNNNLLYAIRFSNNASRYAPFNFISLFNELQKYNVNNYQQINFDEYLYERKLLKK